MAVTTRWNSARMEKKFTDALALASGDSLREDYAQAAADVARETSTRISASGRGGAHNPDFANIQSKAFKSAAGRYNVSVGWLTPPASAAERGSGGKLWYQYQDSGFFLFGGSNWIEGVGATIDQRFRLLDALLDVNVRHVAKLAAILNR